jgi:acetylornithine deacetylase/succinyl-diaminopimelate desuccinylase-like protein
MPKSFMRRVAALILITSTPAVARDLPKSVEEAQNLSVPLLQTLVQIDTSNPPGNETETADFLKRYFDDAGIKAEIYESAPKRGSLVARLKGDGSKKPILLVSHLDVVGVERPHWSVEPFKAEIKGDRMYGRGTSDIKDLAVIQMLAMMLLKNSGKPLHRDIIYASVADEESGGNAGMKYLVEKHWPEIEAEFAFNEGSRGKPYIENGKVTWSSLQVSERRSVNLRMVAHGTSAHSMLQTPDNPIYLLAAALTRVAKYMPPTNLNPALQRYVEGMAKLKHLAKNWYKTAKPGDTEDSKGLFAMMRNTINATIVKGGFRNNVIPTEAEAVINCRIQPGIKTSEVISGVRKAVNDPRVTIEEMEISSDDSPPISSMNSDAVKAYEKVIHENFGANVPFIPTIGAGTTDSRYLREHGVDAYAFEPADDHDQHAHGNDESISIEGLKNAVKLYYEVLLELAT